MPDGGSAATSAGDVSTGDVPAGSNDVRPATTASGFDAAAGVGSGSQVSNETSSSANAASAVRSPAWVAFAGSAKTATSNGSGGSTGSGLFDDEEVVDA